MSAVPVLEIGGSTHVTAALVAETGLVERVHRRPLHTEGDADAILSELASAAGLLSVGPRAWGVALPGPFDYERGIGRYTAWQVRRPRRVAEPGASATAWPG